MGGWRIIVPEVAVVMLLSSYITTPVNAGGKTLSLQESAQFLDLYKRICSSGGPPQQDGNTFYFCKTPDSPTIQLEIQHQTEVSNADTPKQVIFVQSPAYEYTHNLALTGSQGNPQQTEVYVLPPQASHSLRVNDQRVGVRESQKPALFYLNQPSSNNGVGILPIGNNQAAGGNTRPSSPLRPAYSAPNQRKVVRAAYGI